MATQLKDYEMAAVSWTALRCFNVGCGKPIIGRMNGRTFNTAAKGMIRGTSFRSVDVNSWVHLCPSCHVHLIAPSGGLSFPFMGIDEVMKTYEDWDESQGTAAVNTLKPNFHYAGLHFTERALKSALQIVRIEDQKAKAGFGSLTKRPVNTASVEQMGDLIMRGAPGANPIDFCEMVCEWGGGYRVFGNLIGRHQKEPGELREKLNSWFEVVRSSKSDFEIISEGISIKGLGVSFASKHLRMLDPDRFATLDDVISKGLGFALNPAGYRLFLETLREFRKNYWPHLSLGGLEAGIFVLIRQSVRQSVNSGI